MKDKSFAKAMSQIAALDEAQRRQEVARQARAARRAKIARVLAAVLWVAVFAVIFFYRVELQEFANKHVLAAPKVKLPGMAAIGDTNGASRSTGENLKFIQEQAAKRDEALEMTIDNRKK
jgi:hypothetical protein